jgi:hypothetical protein
LAWVPCIVANRRNKHYKNRTSGAIVALVVFLLLFGVLFFVFFNRFDGSTIIIWPIISGLGGFIFVIIIIAAVAASISGPSKNINKNHTKTYQYQPQEQNQQFNPYIFRPGTQKQSEQINNKESKQEIPAVSDINFCRYCGEKVERDTLFCHQCGTKL